MQYRNEIMRDAANHMLAEAGECGWWGGSSCCYRKLGHTRRYGTAKFDAIAVSTITSRDRWQAMTFPAHKTDNGWVIDFVNPITVTNGSGHVRAWEDGFADQFVDKALDVTIDCSNKDLELAYMIAYIER